MSLYYPALIDVKKIKSPVLYDYAKKLIVLINSWSKIQEYSEKKRLDPLFMSDQERIFMQRRMASKTRKEKKKLSNAYWNLADTFLGDYDPEVLMQKENYIVDDYLKWRKLKEKEIKIILENKKNKKIQEESINSMDKDKIISQHIALLKRDAISYPR
jgi:hypothetical protein